MAGGGNTSSGVRAAGPPLTKFQEWFAFALVTSLFFLWGFSYSLVDVLNKKVQHSFDITLTESTAIQACYFGAYFVYSIPASMIASRWGYRVGILQGLALFIIGALLFWPAAHYAVFWPFPICAFIIASGLASLEVMANSYVTVLGSPERAAFRLNFAQAFNGLATFIGPQIASHTFLKDDSKDLTQLQWVYLGVACLGGLVFVLFAFAKLPEISESAIEEAQEEAGVVDNRPLWKRKHTVFGFITQFCYVGAQCSVAACVINYLTDNGAFKTQTATQMFSYMQITFMCARFLGIVIVRFVPATIALGFYGALCAGFSIMAACTSGKTGMAALFIVFVGESIVYPCIFTLGTQNLGALTKRGAGLLVMGVAGGACFPSMQASLADAKTIELSYLIPGLVGFLPIIPYAISMHIYNRRINSVISAPGPSLERGDSYEDKAVIEKLERA
ncbi:hypothetical protein JCM8097_004173 [Rhodosporidiobolus ruineniae]